MAQLTLEDLQSQIRSSGTRTAEVVLAPSEEVEPSLEEAAAPKEPNFRTASSEAPEKDPRREKSFVMAEVEEWLLSLGRKVVVEDVNSRYDAPVRAWVKGYKGDFDFVLSARKKFEGGGFLSPGFTKGILNCWQNDAKRMSKNSKAHSAVNPKVSSDEHMQIPDGSYALHTKDGAVNEIAFYDVEQGKGETWGHRKFVRLHKTDYRQNLSTRDSIAVLDRIAEDIMAASTLYGREMSVCGMCNRELTSDESRAKGIGPICESKMGF